MHILQLKPHQESFYKVIHYKIKGLDAIVLCEVTSDTDVPKKIGSSSQTPTKRSKKGHLKTHISVAIKQVRH